LRTFVAALCGNYDGLWQWTLSTRGNAVKRANREAKPPAIKRGGPSSRPLFSDDLKHGQKFGTLTAANPFHREGD
jgi:hypothetical protein